jgi:hypothetical protein
MSSGKLSIPVLSRSSDRHLRPRPMRFSDNPDTKMRRLDRKSGRASMFTPTQLMLGAVRPVGKTTV